MPFFEILNKWEFPMNTKVFLIVAISWISFFLFAFIFFSVWLFRDYEVQLLLVQFLFALSFMFSFSIFEMVIFEVAGILPLESRQLIWRIDLTSMSILLVCILPWYFFYTVAKEYRFRNRIAIPLSFLFALIYLHFFWRLGHSFDVLSSNIAAISIEGCIGTISVMGVTCMAVLSGFGAVNCPFEYVSLFRRNVSSHDIEFLQRRLLQTVNIVYSKKKKILLEKNAHRRQQHPNKKISMYSRIHHFFKFSGHEDKEFAIDALVKEVHILEKLIQELFLELYHMQLLQDRSNFSHTIRGRLLNFLGYILSGYCIFKVFMTSINILFTRDPTKDPISFLLEHILFIWPNIESKINVKFISEAASLLLVGILVLTQTRGFLVTLLKLFRAWSSTLSSNSVILLLAQMMGMYFVSAFVLMRMNLPTKNRQNIDVVLGAIEFNTYHRWFDRIFLISSICTIIVLFWLHKSKASRASVEYQVYDKFP